MKAIVAERRWGIHAPWVERYTEPAAGGDDSADEVRKMQPNGKRKQSPSGGNNAHVAALATPLSADKSSPASGGATLSLAVGSAGSASGGNRLSIGVNMGYRLIGPPMGNEALARHILLFGRTGKQTPVANMSL